MMRTTRPRAPRQAPLFVVGTLVFSVVLAFTRARSGWVIALLDFT